MGAILKLQESITPSEDMEMVVLKAHLISEVLLRFLLSARLEVPIESLPGLQYQPLALLALGGPGKRTLKKDVLRLNELRNDLAHEVLETSYSAAMWSFVRRWRQASGKRKVGWVHFAKIRFYKINHQIAVEVVKIALNAASPEERLKLIEHFPPEHRSLIADPDGAWAKFAARRPKWKAPLVSTREVTDAVSASQAVVSATKIYSEVMKQLGQLYKDGVLINAERALIEREADVVRNHGRKAAAITQVWRGIAVGQQFAVAYQPYVAGIELLRERLARLDPQ